jgi:TRAP-type mannitol/chloroaromatic compound transport system substrate-binding protein
MTQDRSTGPESVEARTTKKAAARRRFLKSAAVTAGAAATIGFPQISRAQTVRWRMQSGWPSGDIFHEFAGDYTRLVRDLSGGRMEIDLLPAGAVVGALELQDAMVAGALEMYHGVTAYWYGKHKAASLFGTPPAYGWDAHQFLAWHYRGGGEALYNELLQDVLGLDITGWLYGPMPTQALGWFNQDVTSADDFRDMRYRTVGLAADVFGQMGASVTILGGPDIVPSLDRGVIDGAEFNNPTSDRTLGFQDVAKIWYQQSYHQDCEVFEIAVRKSALEGLPDELQQILRFATFAANSDMYWKAMNRYPDDYVWLRDEAKIDIRLTPESVLEAQLAAWDRVIEASSADPVTGEFFARVTESQKEFARKAMNFHFVGDAPKEPAYHHFFGAPDLTRRT